jgi:hypothetical protein
LQSIPAATETASTSFIATQSFGASGKIILEYWLMGVSVLGQL